MKVRGGKPAGGPMAVLRYYVGEAAVRLDREREFTVWWLTILDNDVIGRECQDLRKEVVVEDETRLRDQLAPARTNRLRVVTGPTRPRLVHLTLSGDDLAAGVEAITAALHEQTMRRFA